MDTLVLERPMTAVTNPADNQARDIRLQKRLHSLHEQALLGLKQ